MNGKTQRISRYSPGEELFNSVSHGVGACLAAAALTVLVIRAVRTASPALTALYVTSCALYGATLLILYMSSTLYHALVPFRAKNVFQIFDHSSIYLLIAGTYTPFCLTALHGGFGWALFGVIWGLAITGIVFYCVFGNRLRALSAVTYVLLGWIIVFAFRRLARAVPERTIVFLILGGIAYTAGCPFYALKKIKWMHCIFHLFVLAGSILHFFSIYYMV